jgi:Fe-Mn family superoxide dismutase
MSDILIDCFMAILFPDLPYAYDAFEPYFDAKTMEIHYAKHHRAYYDKFGAAIANYPELQRKTIAEILRNLSALPESIRTIVRNNGGGFYHHNLWWAEIKPDGGGEPRGKMAEIINQKFGTFNNFKTQFTQVATGIFGSGWAWLIKKQSGEIDLMATPNQDSPLSDGLNPLLGLDVWEHAYYLQYQNRRADFIAAWWNVINWERVEERYGQ